MVLLELLMHYKAANTTQIWGKHYDLYEKQTKKHRTKYAIDTRCIGTLLCWFPKIGVCIEKCPILPQVVQAGCGHSLVVALPPVLYTFVRS